MSTKNDFRLPKGSTILITGVTGYIGSWVAHEALSLGYKVRGAIRDYNRAAWLQQFFNDKFPGSYSDILFSGALDISRLDTALDGVDGIIHVAVDSNLSSSADPYISNAIKSTLNILRAAEKANVKSVVLTMSSAGAINAKANTPFVIPKDSYNEEAIKVAWDQEIQFPGKHWVVYSASKAEAEKAAWKFIEENKPQFAFNTVLPDTCFGPPLSIEHQGYPSTGSWPKLLFDGKVSDVPPLPPQHFIDVRDCARIHVAALVSSEAASERFWGFAEPYNFNQVLAIYRKLWPERSFVEDLPDMGKELMTPPSESAGELLKVFGQGSWTSLEKSLKDALEPVVTGQVKNVPQVPLLK